MVNKSIRQRINGVAKSESVERNVNVSDDDSVSGESESESNVTRNTSADDNDSDGQPDSVKSVGVVEVSPGELSEYIAGRVADAGSDSGSDSGRTRRKRSDSGGKRTRKSKQETNAPLVPLINMVHTWASIMLKTPELMLDETETKALSEAYDEFSQHHDVPILSAKRMSEINLGVALLTVYGTRVVAINRRRKQQRAANVVQMPHQQNVAQRAN